MMKKCMALLLAAILTLVSGLALADAPVFEGLAGQIIADMGTGWNLGNTLDSNGEWLRSGSGTPKSYETAWGNPQASQKLIQTIADAGFKTIRVPITWDHHIGPAPEYQVEAAWMDRVQTVVDYCMEAGVYCIINLHHDTGTDGWLHASKQDVEEDSAKFSALWTQIAQRFQDYGDKLIFEGFNEILDEKNNWGYPGAQAMQAVNHFNQLFVDAVRAVGGQNASRCLIVNTYAASNVDRMMAELVLPQDSAQHALMTQVHYYSPLTYCFERANGNNLQTVWTENKGRESLMYVLKNVEKYFTSKGVPTVIGEFGACHKENEADRAAWAKFVVETCETYGVKCIWWDNGGKIPKKLDQYNQFGLIDRYNVKWIFPSIVEAMTGVSPAPVKGQ